MLIFIKLIQFITQVIPLQVTLMSKLMLSLNKNFCEFPHVKKHKTDKTLKA